MMIMSKKKKIIIITTIILSKCVARVFTLGSLKENGRWEKVGGTVSVSRSLSLSLKYGQ